MKFKSKIFFHITFISYFFFFSIFLSSAVGYSQEFVSINGREDQTSTFIKAWNQTVQSDEDEKVFFSDSTLEKLATLKPFFEKPFGQVTAGNSSQVTDGAALLLLASEEAVKRYHFSVLAKIVGTAWAGVDPVMMGIGPVYAMDKLMKQFKLTAKY